MDQKKTEDQEQTKEEFRENKMQDQEDQEDQFAVLDAAIEYKLKGFYHDSEVSAFGTYMYTPLIICQVHAPRPAASGCCGSG